MLSSWKATGQIWIRLFIKLSMLRVHILHRVLQCLASLYLFSQRNKQVVSFKEAFVSVQCLEDVQEYSLVGFVRDRGNFVGTVNCHKVDTLSCYKAVLIDSVQLHAVVTRVFALASTDTCPCLLTRVSRSCLRPLCTAFSLWMFITPSA